MGNMVHVKKTLKLTTILIKIDVLFYGRIGKT